jgi:tRNA threonylcarbamoyl adenosine modification protein YeaZ
VLVLAIDTSSAAVTAALAEVGADGAGVGGVGGVGGLGGVAIRAERARVNAKAHGELLAPSIADCLDEAGATPRDLSAIVAGLGPGPFTGLRVGLVTAAAMADALRVPSYGVCSLDAIGGALPDEPELLVATDARRKEVYWARYAGGERVAGPDVSHPSDLADGSGVAAGAGARLYADVLGLPLRDVDYPCALTLVGLAAERIRSGAPSEPLVPLYLRRPDAVPPGAAKTVSQ